MATVPVGGPKWTSSGQNGPKWAILVHFGRANARIQFGITPVLTIMVVWTILDHFGPVHFPTVPRPLPIPKGPKIEKIKDRPPRLKFKRATQQTPFFWGILNLRGLKFSIEIDFFQSLGP